MKKRGVNCGGFALFVILGMGIILLVLTVRSMQAATESEQWLSSTGIIEETWVERDERTDAEGETEDYYEPHLKYTYSVNESAYSSQRIDFGSQRSYGRASGANNFLAQYPVGSQVDVFYNPAEPWEAVLVREARGATGGLIGSGVMIVFSIVGLVGLLVKGKRAAATTSVEGTFPE